MTIQLYVGQVGVGGLDQLGDEAGRLLEAFRREPVPQARQGSGEKHHDQISEIAAGPPATRHRSVPGRMISGCLDQ